MHNLRWLCLIYNPQFSWWSASQLNPHPRLQLWRGQTFSQQTGGTIHSEQMYSYMKIIFEHMLTSWMKTWQMNLLPPENYIWACATQLEENLVDGFTTAWMACGHIYQSAELSWNISAVTKLASCLSHVNQRVLPMKLQNVTASFHTFGGVGRVLGVVGHENVRYSFPPLSSTLWWWNGPLKAPRYHRHPRRSHVTCNPSRSRSSLFVRHARTAPFPLESSHSDAVSNCSISHSVFK